MWDFCEGEQWTPEEIAAMAARPALGAISYFKGCAFYKANRIGD
jgi:hypothetical protein